MRRTITLAFVLEGGNTNLPKPENLAQSVWDGLPDEWQEYQDDSDYILVAIAWGGAIPQMVDDG